MRDLLLTWRLRRTARRIFGWRSLRAEQVRAILALMRGRDAMVILPTGAGKSAIYQLPGTLLKGPTLVISPLLALQHDQIAGLTARGAEQTQAVRISSAESAKQQDAAIEALRTGQARFLFITPEQLAKPERLAEVRSLRPALVAIDEAHCLSSWGHDFRPDYLLLGQAIDALGSEPKRGWGRLRGPGRGRGRPPVVALTATASPPVREDISARLRLRDPEVVVGALDRPNILLEAVSCASDEQRLRRLVALLDEEQGSGIVYVPTRRAAEELTAELKERGYRAEHYHGGMAPGVRSRRHTAFLDGEIPVMVATSAFGMGIDKPDIRWVVHMALPDSPDSYLQEIGRAGRDGERARALLLHRPEDVALQRYFASGTPGAIEIRDLVAVLRQGQQSRAELRRLSGFSARKLTQLVTLLEEVGAVVSDSEGNLHSPADAPLPVRAAELALAEVERHQTVQRTRIDMMRQFAESRTCRAQGLLGYFGDNPDGPCGHCDNCARPTASASTSAAPGAPPRQRRAARRRTPVDPVRPYPLHSTVHHRSWGAGTVLGYDEDRMTVLFDEVGYKTLSVKVVSKQNLLVHDADRDGAPTGEPSPA